MARRSKTKVGGGPRQETMLRAAEAGARGVAQGREALTRAREGATEQGLRAAQVFGGLAEQGEARQQRGEIAEKQLKQQRQIETERQDLRAAEQGLVRDPEFARREQQLQEEMERGERQATAPGELDRERFVPTERREQMEERQMQVQETRAEAMLRNAKSRALSARIKGDQVGYKAEKENYASQMKRTVERADRIIEGALDPTKAGATADDVNYIKRLAGNNPNPDLQAELDSGQLGPHAARFLRGRAMFDSLDFVRDNGDWPDPDLIDEAHPMYQEFQGYVVGAGDLLRQRQQMGALAGVRSLVEANRLKRRLAATTMMAMHKIRAQQRAMGPMGMGARMGQMVRTAAMPGQIMSGLLPQQGGQNVQPQPGAPGAPAGAPGQQQQPPQ